MLQCVKDQAKTMGSLLFCLNQKYQILPQQTLSSIFQTEDTADVDAPLMCFVAQDKDYLPLIVFAIPQAMLVHCL